jgi:ABC-2 type transport system ATP-binding protein
VADPHPVETERLTKHYRHPLLPWRVRVKALSDFTFHVERGEVFGLLGPNGSGKSTTIKLLLGLSFPTSGRVALFGRPPSDVEVRRRIGYVPEESPLYRFLDAEETLDFYGRLFGLDRKERRRRVAQLLDYTGLSGEAKRPVGEYSKGMLRRVAIAQSLINDPELLILDEPASGMDPIGTAEVKELILGLKAKGKTVLLSSHQLADVEQVCDRVAILYGGREQATGKTSDLLRAGSPAGVHSLEEVFLTTVRRAQAQGAQTSGATATSRTPLEFLSGAPDSK